MHQQSTTKHRTSASSGNRSGMCPLPPSQCIVRVFSVYCPFLTQDMINPCVCDWSTCARNLQSLASCCNEFDPSTYARTLVGCFMLDAHASKGGIGGYGLIQDDEEEEGVGGTPGVGRGRGGEGEPGCIAGLAFRLQSFLLETIKTKSQDAIIDVLMLRDEALPANTSEQSKAAPSRARAGTATDEAAAVVTDEAMRERYRLKSFSELCGRVPSEYLPVATARVCEAVAEVMHTHFLLLQWHRAPFHSQHNDPEWLHRSLPGGDDALADFDDDSDGGPESGGVLDQDYVVDLDSHLAVPGESAAAAGESSTEGGREGVSSPKPIASTAASRAAAAHRLLQVDQVMETVQLKGLQWRDALQAVRPALLHSRRVIWQHVQQRVAGLLFDACTSMRSELSVPSLLACLAICQRLMVVGQAYSEEPSHNLKGALQLLCRQQMDQVHRKAFDGLRTMLSRETWRRIPVPLEQLGGIRGLVMRSAGTRAGMAAVASVQVRTAAAIATGAMDATPGRDYQDAASGMVGARTLHVWHVEGNPLKSVLDVLQLQTFELNEHGLPRCLAAQLAAADAAPDDGVDANSDAESDAAPNTPGGHGSDGSGSDEEPQQGVLAVLGGASGVKSSFRQDHPYVVTMSALNGFAKHVSKYLQLMEFLSSVSMDAFIGLQKLFELYLYTVATQFFSVAAMKFLFTEYAIVGVPEPAPTTNPSGTGVAAGGGAASPAAPVDAFAGAKGAGTGKTPSDQLPQTPTAVCLFQELEPDSFDFKDKAPLAVAHMITPLLLPADHHTKSGRRRRTARDKSCGALEALNAAYARTSAATFPYESLRLTLLRTKFENETGQRFSTDSDLLAAVEVEGVDTANPRSLPQPFVALTPEVKLGASNNHAVVERYVHSTALRLTRPYSRATHISSRVYLHQTHRCRPTPLVTTDTLPLWLLRQMRIGGVTAVYVRHPVRLPRQNRSLHPPLRSVLGQSLLRQGGRRHPAAASIHLQQHRAQGDAPGTRRSITGTYVGHRQPKACLPRSAVRLTLTLRSSA